MDTVHLEHFFRHIAQSNLQVLEMKQIRAFLQYEEHWIEFGKILKNNFSSQILIDSNGQTVTKKSAMRKLIFKQFINHKRYLPTEEVYQKKRDIVQELK